MGCRRWRTRLAELERLLPKPLPPEDPQREKRRRLVRQRLVRLCKEACPLLTGEEQIKVAEALRQWAETEQGPYAWWFRDLFRGLWQILAGKTDFFICHRDERLKS